MPFASLSNYALANLLITCKERIMEILIEMKINDILTTKYGPTDLQTIEDFDCQYFDVHQYNLIPEEFFNGIAIFHQNIRSLPKNVGHLIAFLIALKKRI